MVHYIRFLKVPQVSPKVKHHNVKDGHIISAVLTVTSDLGETFFPDDIELQVRLWNSDSPKWHEISQNTAIYWTPGSRVVKLKLLLSPGQLPKRKMIVHVSTKGTDWSVSKHELPEIVDAWSSEIPCDGLGVTENLVRRQIHTFDDGTSISIWEETGESIARHIWDASLGVIILLKNLMTPNIVNDVLPILSEVLSGGRTTTADASELKQLQKKRGPLNVLELGAGCGIAGIALAQVVPGCKVILTDLQEAQDIMQRNIKHTPLPDGSSLQAKVLSWETRLTSDMLPKRLDLVVVCDCIYNADSDPALVGMLQQILTHSQHAKILVATKRRHYSETVFFELMEQVKIPVLQKCVIPLPHHMTDADVAEPEVEVYLYGLEGKF